MNNFLVLVKDNLSNSLRSKKAIIFFLLYFAMFMLIASALFYIQNSLDNVLGHGTEGVKNPAFINGMEKLTQDKSFVDFITRIPFINIALFVTTIIIAPFLILILNYDKIAQEIYDGTIRYLLFRTSRFKIYAAKFFSETIEIGIITFLTVFIALAWGSTQIHHFDVGKSLWFGIQYWLIAQPLLWVFIAFSLFFSSIFKKPFHALVFSMLGFFLLTFLPHWIPYFSPLDGFYTKNLYSDVPLKIATALMYFFLFTLAYLSAGFSIFNRKDV